MTSGRGMSSVDHWLRGHPALLDAGLAVVLGAVLIPASVPLALDSDAGIITNAAVVLAVLVAQVSVAFRRVRPVAAFVACAASMAMLVTAPSLTGLEGQGFSGPVPPIVLPSSAVFLLLLYSIAVYGPGRWPVLALALAGVGGLLTAARLLSAEVVSAVALSGWPLPVIICGALAALVVAAWSLGRFHRVRADYVAALADRAEQAEANRAQRAEQAAAQERARIAREMHDVVSHSLAVMVAQAEAGRMAAAKDPVRAVAVLPTIARTGREAMADMRSMLGILRSETGAADAPATEAPPPQPGLPDIVELVDRMRDAGMPIALTQSGSAEPLGTVRELAAYRVVQESLTNVIKHAGETTSVTVDLRWSSTELSITVADDGKEGESARPTTVSSIGRGLQGMRERVGAVGGRCITGPGQRGGYRVLATIPVPERPDETSNGGGAVGGAHGRDRAETS